MHIAQRKKLDVHKTKRKRGRNRTTTSLVLDSSMQRGRWEFRLNQRIWLRLLSVFESRRISFLKIFLVRHGNAAIGTLFHLLWFQTMQYSNFFMQRKELGQNHFMLKGYKMKWSSLYVADVFYQT